MHGASPNFWNDRLISHSCFWYASPSSHFPSRASSYSLTLCAGMMQAGPAIQPTPPSIITNSGIWAEALKILILPASLLAIVSSLPVLPEASLMYSILGTSASCSIIGRLSSVA